jgi:hypothetical protein
LIWAFTSPKWGEVKQESNRRSPVSPLFDPLPKPKRAKKPDEYKRGPRGAAGADDERLDRKNVT